MAEPEVAEPQVLQHADLAGDRRLIREKLDAVLYRQVEHLGDALVLVFHLKRVLIVACSLARRAKNLHVGHEGELRRDRPFAGTLLATAALDVEAEGRGGEAAFFRVGGFGEKRPYRVVKADVSRRVGTR